MELILALGKRRVDYSFFLSALTMVLTESLGPYSHSENAHPSVVDAAACQGKGLGDFLKDWAG